MKFASHFHLMAALLLCSCSSQSDGPPAGPNADAPQTPTNAPAKSKATRNSNVDEWIGVYSSPSEIGGFTGTVLVIESWGDNDLTYRKTFHSDVVSSDSIEQDMRSGSCLTEGNCIYIPKAYGYYHDGKPRLQASVDRYTKVIVNGQVTLMRDDAHTAFRTENKLYDYGILIKVSNETDLFLDFAKVEHKSINILFDDKTKEWKDPFVYGPNER